MTDVLEDFDSSSDDSRKRLLWAVRAGLIAADAVASGLFRKAEDLKAWLAERFENAEDCDAAYIRREIIDKRIKQLGDTWKGWHKFQDDTAVQSAHPAACAVWRRQDACRLAAGSKSRRDCGR